eukprot:gene2632-5244_t
MPMGMTMGTMQEMRMEVWRAAHWRASPRVCPQYKETPLVWMSETQLAPCRHAFKGTVDTPTLIASDFKSDSDTVNSTDICCTDHVPSAGSNDFADAATPAFKDSPQFHDTPAGQYAASPAGTFAAGPFFRMAPAGPDATAPAGGGDRGVPTPADSPQYKETPEYTYGPAPEDPSAPALRDAPAYVYKSSPEAKHPRPPQVTPQFLDGSPAY